PAAATTVVASETTIVAPAPNGEASIDVNRDGVNAGVSVGGANVGLTVAAAPAVDTKGETVIVDWSRYRTRPSDKATVRGLVRAGTPVQKLCWTPGSGVGWYKVNIPGRASNVYIYEMNVSHLHGVP